MLPVFMYKLGLKLFGKNTDGLTYYERELNKVIYTYGIKASTITIAIAAESHYSDRSDYWHDNIVLEVSSPAEKVCFSTSVGKASGTFLYTPLTVERILEYTNRKRDVIKSLYRDVPEVDKVLRANGYSCDDDMKAFMNMEIDKLIYISSEEYEKKKIKEQQECEEQKKREEQKKEEQKEREKQEYENRKKREENQFHDSRSALDEVAWSFSILGLDKHASFDEVKSAYRKMAKEFHPDTILGKDLNKEFVKFATKKFQDIEKAYETLKKYFRID